MNKFLYYILKEDGRSGKVVNDVVTFTGVPTPLTETPDGWQELSIGWERDLKYHGIVRNFSLPFGFVKDGAKIIRDALYNQSIEEKLFLLIQQLTLVYTDTTYEWRYEYLYKGELDLSAAEDGQDMINVPCMEGSLAKLLKANISTKYKIPFDLDAINIQWEGIALQENAHYVTAGQIDNAFFNLTHTIPITFVNKEGSSSGVGFFSQAVEDVFSPVADYVDDSLNYFFVNNTGSPITATLKGTVPFMCVDNDASQRYRWFAVKNDNSSVEIYNSVADIPVGEQQDAVIDYTFTLNDGQRIFFIGQFWAGSGGTQIVVDFLDTSNLNLTFETTGATTRVKAFKKSTLYKRLIGKITGDEANAKSELCELWDNIPVTCGDAIRGLPDSFINTSLSDFFQDVDSTLMAGLSVANGFIELEARENFYDTSEFVDLGTVKDIIYSPAIEFIYNKFKQGHPKPDIEDINGRYDPNGSSEFTGVITKVVREYNNISPYKAGPYEMESIRLNLNGLVTSDDNRDSDIYVVNCERHEEITATIDFITSLSCFIISSSEFLAVGQQVEFVGSVNNPGLWNITAIASGLLFQIIVITGANPVVDEAAIPVTITVTRGEVMTLNRPTYTTLEGVPNDTIFNLPNLTPKAMLLKHGKWIRSGHKGLETGLLKFNSGDKNTDLLTTLAGVTIDEDADESIAALGDAMFLPFYATFTTKVPVGLSVILEDTPNKCFRFADEDGNQFEGFLISAAIAPNDQNEQEFKVLLTPNNDLTLLT